VSWQEAASEHFAARFAAADAPAAREVLGALEAARARLGESLPALPRAPVDVVLHGSRAQLHLAQPALLATPPALRDVVLGRAAGGTVHLLSPRLHRDGLAAPALFAQLALQAAHPPLRAPARRLRHRWLLEGAADWLTGRVPTLRARARRRLRAGARPAFPPAARDAPLFGGLAVELVARERGPDAVLGLLGALGTRDEVLAGLAAAWPRHLELER
jgi:hypothetical protein